MEFDFENCVEILLKEIENKTFNFILKILQFTQFSFFFFLCKKSYTKQITVPQKLAGEKRNMQQDENVLIKISSFLPTFHFDSC